MIIHLSFCTQQLTFYTRREKAQQSFFWVPLKKYVCNEQVFMFYVCIRNMSYVCICIYVLVHLCTLGSAVDVFPQWYEAESNRQVSAWSGSHYLVFLIHTRDDFINWQHQENVSLFNPADSLACVKLPKKTSALFDDHTASHSTFRHQ